MKIILFLTLLMFSSCAYQDPYFQPYTQKVIDYCIEYDCGLEDRIAMISIKFGKLEQAVGECQLNGIVIDSEQWEYKQEIDREVLILHEYGHCALGRDDIYEIDPSIGYPTSLMYFEPWRTVNFYRHEEYKIEFLEELFK